MNKQNRGVALLVAVIFTAVMLAFGVLISSLGYKQSILARSARDSFYAFYAADAALECLLHADQRDPENNAFMTTGAHTVNCGGASPIVTMQGTTDLQGFSAPFSIGGRYCAQITVYKPANGLGKTWLFSEGYSTSCDKIGVAGAQYSVRGLKAAY